MKGEGPRVGPIPPSRFLPLPGGRFGRETAAAAGGSRCPPPSFPPPPRDKSPPSAVRGTAMNPRGAVGGLLRVLGRREAQPVRGDEGGGDGEGSVGTGGGSPTRDGVGGASVGGARGRYVGGGRKGVPRRRCGSRVAVAERAGGTGGGPRGVARMGRTRASHAGWGHDGDTMGGGGDSTGVGDACRG